MTVINAQMYGPGSAWGARSGIPTHAPVHLVQARRNSLPIAAGSCLRVFLLTSQLAGGFAASRLFSQFSLRGGSSPVLREGDRLRPLPLVAGRHKFRSRFAGCHRPGRVRRCPGIGCHFKASQHAVQSLADVPKSHSVQCLSVCGWCANTQPREVRDAITENRTFGTRHDR
jgi:hypothetical protein